MRTASIGWRWTVFNLVGVAGALLQMAALAILIWAGVGWMPATLVAVEAAVLHNFVWHTRLTWRHCPATSVKTTAGRLVRFHLINGLVSILGNLFVMTWLVTMLGWHAVAANGAAIVICGLVNFVASDRAVFMLAKPPGMDLRSPWPNG